MIWKESPKSGPTVWKEAPRPEPTVWKDVQKLLRRSGLRSKLLWPQKTDGCFEERRERLFRWDIFFGEPEMRMVHDSGGKDTERRAMMEWSEPPGI